MQCVNRLNNITYYQTSTIVNNTSNTNGSHTLFNINNIPKGMYIVTVIFRYNDGYVASGRDFLQVIGSGWYAQQVCIATGQISNSNGWFTNTCYTTMISTNADGSVYANLYAEGTGNKSRLQSGTMQCIRIA